MVEIDFSFLLSYNKVDLRVWRNWQTRKIQILVLVRVVQVQVLLSALNCQNKSLWI